MKKTLFLLFLVFNINVFAQLTGCYCCDNNWTRVEFAADSIKIIKPFYYGGHLPAVGKGLYRLENDSLYIIYIQESNAECEFHRDGNVHQDSIELYFTGALPTTVMYLTEKKIDAGFEQYFNVRKTIERQNYDLCLSSLSSKLIIPKDSIINSDITSLKIYFDDQLYVKERIDFFNIRIVNESEIILNKQKLTKINCNKKSSPIY